MNTQTDTGPTATLEDLYDPAFREQVRDNDPSALAMLGLSQDHQPEIRVVTDRSDTLHISLPRELPDNLSAADLENISAAGSAAQEWAKAQMKNSWFYPGMGDHISHPQSEDRGG
ncbi:MAG: hypothetical protein OXU71_00635 [Gammaproteobacteria bacterium]|nr:hypothetical protein [Gammaproteobacteria bacterium]